MVNDQPPLPVFFKDIHLFSTLDESQLARLQEFFNTIELAGDTPIINPDDREVAFYIIYQGQVALSEKIHGGRVQMNILVEGDFFGEEMLLAKRPRPFSAKATTPVVLLYAKKEPFEKLLMEFPGIREDLVNSIESRRIIEAHNFNWLAEDEVIYQVRRHHVVVLLLMLILPGLVVALGLFFAGLAWTFWATAWARNVSLVFSSIVLGIGLGWTIWNWIDWGNDYFVVTNQRVVCLKVVIGLYESRNEAPMDTILSLDSRSSFLGRRLGYGNVLVKTYTTQLILDAVSNPKQLNAVINELLNRSKRSLQKADYQAMVKSVERIIISNQKKPKENQSIDSADQTAVALPAPITQSVISIPTSAVKTADQPVEPGFWTKYFGGILKTRYEQGKTITYRKHWYDLLRRAGWATLLILALGSLVISYDVMYFLGSLRFISPYLVTGVGFVILFFILFPWWLYNYIDWRNDIYQVTDRSIFDIERRPFGTETRKTAALENILSLEYERLGFLGYILNVGNVIIDIGEAKFCFNDVYEPARVQQDIFSRMQQMRYNKSQEEINRERDRILKLLEIYHQEVTKDTAILNMKQGNRRILYRKYKK